MFLYPSCRSARFSFPNIKLVLISLHLWHYDVLVFACLVSRVRSSVLIVVPTLNSHALLPRLISSLRNQVWPHWRVLFIDGPSGPQHRHYLQQYCDLEPRCSWVVQDQSEPGIFGAMNQGFAAALDSIPQSQWLLFWGSDDWAASSTVLADAMAFLDAAANSSEGWPDLLICMGRYVDAATGALSRPTVFQPPGLINSSSYRRALLLGSTPPHQATLFGPGALRFLSRYATGFNLSADLDYFLQISRHPGLRVQCLDLELVLISAGGISGQQTQRRLMEVHSAYARAFGWCWWFAFFARYVRRFASLFERTT
jgi:hypothetical protein